MIYTKIYWQKFLGEDTPECKRRGALKPEDSYTEKMRKIFRKNHDRYRYGIFST
jgi:hypothetical protein